MRTVVSAQNAEIKAVVALKNSKDRYEQGRFIAEGQRVISTFIQSGWAPLALYATEKMCAIAQQLVGPSRVTVVPVTLIKKMSHATTPSELLAVFAIPPKPAISLLQRGLVLAQLSDPGNVGTLMRTCAAMNVQCIVLVEGVDPWHPKVVQATAGTSAMLTIFQLSWAELIAHKGDLKLYALTVSGGEKPDTVKADSALLVVGNEAHGLPNQWRADCDGAITIPMPGNAESLNAAVAGSIAVYELF